MEHSEGTETLIVQEESDDYELEERLDLLQEKGEFISLESCKSSVWLSVLKWLLVIISGGLFGLCLLWNKNIHYWFERRCSVVEADKFLIETFTGDVEEAEVISYQNIKYFQFSGLRYIFDGKDYVQAVSYLKNWTHRDILDKADGLQKNNITDLMRIQEGTNLIEVPVLSLWRHILNELFQPDFIYIYLCCLLWFFHKYAIYSSVILVSCVISGLWESYTQRQIRLHIRKMAQYAIDIHVLRDGHWHVMSSKELLPGDIIDIPRNGYKAPCDVALIQGSAIVDESSLTGESIPVVKLKIDDNPHKIYDPDKDKKCTIYSGTSVIGALTHTEDDHESKVLAIVTRTGWRTSKGQLIRSILNVTPITYQYDYEARIFLGLLVITGIGFCIFSVYMWDGFNSFTGDDIMYGFEMIAMIVPPLLPALFHIGVLISAKNLQHYKIFTTDPSRIPLSAKIHVMCFDKTGTLTKDDLDMIGVVPVYGNKSQKKFGELSNSNMLDLSADLMASMTTCHSLMEYDQRILQNFDHPEIRRYSGNTVDVKIFTFTGWEYHDARISSEFPYVTSPDRSQKFEILKRFDFDPTIQRMSVIFRDVKSGQVFVASKGSPEVMRDCCTPESLPADYAHEIKHHSRNGCYVLAICITPRADLDTSDLVSIHRADIEKELDFVGLVLLRNELKPDTPSAIEQLHQGCVRTVIITGDNIFTAFYIARKCNIVPENNFCFIGDVEDAIECQEKLGKTGVVFRNPHNPDMTMDLKQWMVVNRGERANAGESRITVKPWEVSLGVTSAAWEALRRESKEYDDFLRKKVTIFARMKPLQKGEVIDLLKDSKCIIGMCGDGANDCAALSLAHCGIALSEAEASVVSSFTAQQKNIPSVVHLIREGRACLANSFAMFKLTLVSGSFEMTQALLAYVYGTDLSEWQYVIIDFLIFIPFAFYTVKSLAAQRLEGDPPSTKVFGWRTLSSLIGVLTISEVMIWLGIVSLSHQSWYTPSSVPSSITYYSIPETTSTWLIGNFAYSAMAIAFAFGSNHRQPFWLNLGLVASVWLVLGFTCALIWIYPDWDRAGIYPWMSFVHLTLEMRFYIFVIGWVGFFVILFYEKIFVYGPLTDFLKTRFGRTRKVRGYSQLPKDTILIYNNEPDYSPIFTSCCSEKVEYIGGEDYVSYELVSNK